MAIARNNRRAIDRSKPQYTSKKGKKKYPFKFPDYKGQSKKTLAWVDHVKATRAAHGGGKKCTYSEAMVLASKTWKGR